MNQQLNMVGAGGPVGAMQMMGQAGSRGHPAADNNQRVLLNTYIYDYLLKNHHYNLARSFHQELPINMQPRTKQSPSRRDVNGVDDAMDTDSKDIKRPDDLPDPSIPSTSSENCFLYDWWCQFWDIYGAQRKQPNSGATTNQYLSHTIQNRMRQDSQNRMLRGGDPNMMMNYNMMRMQNGRSINPLQQQAMTNNRNLTPQQMQVKNQMMQNSMQRDGSGNGPQSPGSGENAPSPSKRQKVDAQGGFVGQIGPAGRGQGMPGQVPGGPNGQLMLPNGMNELPQAALQKMEGMNPGGAQGSPMIQQAGENFIDSMPPGRVMGGPPGQPTQQGNHALQDYQMQLMLLEQQNKKRLLMARQEQENITQPPPGSAPMGGQGPGFAPTMSPSGSRAGPSPNPTDQMKRATPKLGPAGVPGSPMPDAMAQNRGSPVPNFDPGQVPPNMPQQYYAQMAGQNGIMRPPSSHPNLNMANMTPQQMETIRATGRLPNGMPWQSQGGQQMMPQNQGGPQPAQMGTPRQAQNAMPPPPAPQSEQAQRTQPSSPAQPAAPPTPSQTTKANPKAKKDKQEARKKQTKSKAGATPAAEPEQPPPTPTPSTPITPMHSQSFNNQKNGVAQQANQQQPQQPAAPAHVAAPQMDPSVNQPFAGLDDNSNGFNLDFSSVLDGSDVLESFDFDSFLHTDDGNNNFGLDPSFAFNPDAVEAGTGDIA